LKANKPEDIATIISSVTEDEWHRMSQACIQWWKDNASVEGSFRTTMKIVNEMKAKIGTYDRCHREILPMLVPYSCDSYGKTRDSDGYVVPIPDVPHEVHRLEWLHDSIPTYLMEEYILFHIHGDNRHGHYNGVPKVLYLTYISKEHVCHHGQGI
jgi:hypothetical protein